jgi:hypothetical protein
MLPCPQRLCFDRVLGCHTAAGQRGYASAYQQLQEGETRRKRPISDAAAVRSGRGCKIEGNQPTNGATGGEGRRWEGGRERWSGGRTSRFFHRGVERVGCEYIEMLTHVACAKNLVPVEGRAFRCDMEGGAEVHKMKREQTRVQDWARGGR